MGEPIDGLSNGDIAGEQGVKEEISDTNLHSLLDFFNPAMLVYLKANQKSLPTCWSLERRVESLCWVFFGILNMHVRT